MTLPAILFPPSPLNSAKARIKHTGALFCETPACDIPLSLLRARPFTHNLVFTIHPGTVRGSSINYIRKISIGHPSPLVQISSNLSLLSYAKIGHLFDTPSLGSTLLANPVHWGREGVSPNINKTGQNWGRLCESIMKPACFNLYTKRSTVAVLSCSQVC